MLNICQGKQDKLKKTKTTFGPTFIYVKCHIRKWFLKKC